MFYRTRPDKGVFLIIPVLAVVLFFTAPPTHAEQAMKSGDATIIFPDGLFKPALEVRKIYPGLEKDIERKLHLSADIHPKIILVNRGDFLRMAGTPVAVAFAQPERGIIVLDISRVYAKPFNLNSSLSHELCHLVLHGNIKSENLPRWIDEGVCQWFSDGVDEIEAGERIVLSGTEMSPLSRLSRFPEDDAGVRNAYAESRSVVEYIVKEYGKNGLYRTLEGLKQGRSPDEALKAAISLDTDGLYARWRRYMERKNTVFLFLSREVYPVLFFLAALATICGYARFVKRRKEYKDEDENDEEDDQGRPF